MSNVTLPAMTTLPCGMCPTGPPWLLKTSLNRESKSASLPSSTRRTVMQDSDMLVVMKRGKDECDTDRKRRWAVLNEGMLFRACQADKILGVDRH